MIHVLLGPDHSLVKAAARQRAFASDPAGEETVTLDGASSTLQEVLMAVASVGFFSSGRTVIVDNLIQKHGKLGAAEWTVLLTGVPPASTLILADSSVLSLPAAVKKALPADAEVYIGDPPRGRDLIEWIVARAKATGGKLDRGVAQKLAQTLYPTSWGQKARNAAFDRPPDMESLGNEVDKLVTAALPGEVSEWHIRQLVAAGDNDQVFTFIDAAAAGNLRAATVELDKLLAAGEDPYKLMAQLASSVELAAVLSMADRRDPVEVGKDLKLPNANRMTSIARSVQGQPRGFAPYVAQVLEEVDRQMKTGELRNPTDALYTAIARIAALRSPALR